MASISKVELHAAIRRVVRDGMSTRAVGREYGVGFRTLRKALASVWPEPRRQLQRRRSRLDPYHGVIDGWSRADLDAATARTCSITPRGITTRIDAETSLRYRGRPDDRHPR